MGNHVRAAALAAALAALTTTTMHEAMADVDEPTVLHGTVAETTTGAALGYDLGGRVRILATDGGTDGHAVIEGLDPSKRYTSHLHDAPCATGGGAHYQHVEGGGTTPPNELWFRSGDSATLDPNRGGVARGEGSAAWRARTSGTGADVAASVVVHEPGTGARIACADLG